MFKSDEIKEINNFQAPRIYQLAPVWLTRVQLWLQGDPCCQSEPANTNISIIAQVRNANEATD